MFRFLLFQFTCVVAIALPATSQLIELDLDTPGDGLVTRDTATNLDWLDITATSGITYDEIIGGAGGWVSAGWRHATGAEVCDLFANYALAPSPCPDSFSVSSTEDLTSELIGLLGFTTSFGAPPCGECVLFTYGLYDDGGGSLVGQAALTLVDTSLLNFMTYSEVVDDAAGSSEIPVPDLPDLSTRGHFLVIPVPEPSRVLLLAFGLPWLAALSRRRHRRGRGR